MFTKNHSVDNFYTAKLTKMLTFRALALYKNITKTAITRYQSGFRRGFPLIMWKTMLKTESPMLTTSESRCKVKNYQQNKLFFHKISTVNQQFYNLEP